jgi:hypothetical protein
MTSKTQYYPPRKSPKVAAELESLYRRRLLVQKLVRCMEAYVRACPQPKLTSRKVA